MAEAVQAQAEVVVKPVSAKEAVKVAQGRNTELQKYFGNLPIGTIEAVAGAEIPQGTKDSLLISLFGEKSSAPITDAVLKPLCQSLEAQIDTLQNNLKEGPTTLTELNQAIESAILQTPGFGDIYSKLSPTEKQVFVKRIKDMGVQAFGRRLFMEKAIVSTEATQYSTAKSKYDRIDAELTAKGTEQTSLKAAVGTTEDIATVTAHKQTTERELNLLISQKETLEQKKQAIEQQKTRQRNLHIQKSINTATSATPYDAAAGIAADLNIQDSDAQLVIINGQITVIDGGISGKSTNLSTYEKQVSQLQRIAQLDTEMSTLKQQLTTVNTDMLTARGELIKKINQLTKDFNSVLPAASKEALETFKARVEEANREKTINEAEKKKEKAQEEGDMLTAAEADLILAVENRYVTQENQRRLSNLFRAREINIIDVSKLRTEFTGMFGATNRGSADLIRTMLNIGGVPPGSGSGLKQETIDYLITNPKAVEKLIDKMRVPVFKSVSRQAVRHLNLTQTDIMTLGNSPAFIEAAKVAITENKDLLNVVESLTGAKLGGGKNLGEMMKKIPAGVLLGLIMLVFGLFGTHSLFGIPKHASSVP